MDMIEARIKEYKKTINDLENKLIVESETNKELKRILKGLKSDVLIYKIQYDNLKKEIERLKKDELNHSYIPTSNINTTE